MGHIKEQLGLEETWRSYSPTSLLKTQQVGSVSSHVLNKYEGSIASLGCLFQCLTTFIVKKKSFLLCLHRIWCTLIRVHVPFDLSLKKAWFCLFHLPPPIQVFIHIDHIFPGSSLLLAKQSQISQPLKHQMLQSLYHLRGLPLSLFQCVHVSLILWSSDLDLAVQMCLTRAEQRGRITPITASSALPNAPQSSLLQGCTAGSCSDG